MLNDSFFKIICDTYIEGTITTFENVKVNYFIH